MGSAARPGQHTGGTGRRRVGIVEDLILLTREEAWEVLRVLERAVDAADRSGTEDAEANAAFRVVASKLLPDLFPDD